MSIFEFGSKFSKSWLLFYYHLHSSYCWFSIYLPWPLIFSSHTIFSLWKVWKIDKVIAYSCLCLTQPLSVFIYFLLFFCIHINFYISKKVKLKSVSMTIVFCPDFSIYYTKCIPMLLYGFIIIILIASTQCIWKGAS